MSNIIILGAQWGDEGKGKLVDLLADRFDYVIRYQGGHNAGHTILIGERKFVLRLVPSGILHPGKIAVIGNGLVIDPLALLEEVGQLIAAGVDVNSQLRISNRAHVLVPSHRLVEKISEAVPGKVAIGTTSRGIGPGYHRFGRRAPAWREECPQRSMGPTRGTHPGDARSPCSVVSITDGRIWVAYY